MLSVLPVKPDERIASLGVATVILGELSCMFYVLDGEKRYYLSANIYDRSCLLDMSNLCTVPTSISLGIIGNAFVRAWFRVPGSARKGCAVKVREAASRLFCVSRREKMPWLFFEILRRFATLVILIALLRTSFFTLPTFYYFYRHISQSIMSNSAHDFFASQLSPNSSAAAAAAAPKPSLRARGPNKKKGPPPPPLARPPAARTTTTTTTKPRPIATSTTTSATTFAGPPAARTTTTTKTTRPILTSKSKAAAPVMSRPVGGYYGSTSSSNAQPTAAANNNNSGGYYGSSNFNTATTSSSSNAASAATAASKSDTWDWNTPAPAATSTSQTTNTTWAAPAPAPVAVSNSMNDWATPAPAAVSSSNDWYTPSSNDATTSTNNNNNMYSSTGFASNTAAAASNPNNPYAQPQQQPQLSGSMDNNPYAPQPQLSGSMDNNTSSIMTAAPTVMQPQQFMPSASSSSTSTSMMDADEPPLLEELGIHWQHILLKTKAVIVPFSRFGGDQVDHHQICQDADLAGPIAYCLLLGGEMVLTGKLQFGYIYGFGLFGCFSMTLIVNLMSPSDAISFWTVASILGYALIPVNVLGILKIIVMQIANAQTLGRFLGILTVAWSTMASTRLLELGCGLREQRYLIAYPIALLYSAFVLITIF